MKKLMFLGLLSVILLASCQNTSKEKTIANLKEGIIGETTASAKYAAFATKAYEEGYDTIAKLFEAASKSEAIHAANHKKVLESLGVEMEEFTPEFTVGTTAENLKAAIKGETYEIDTMYVQFINEAKAEKVNDAVKSFTWARDTEMKHLEFYKKALAALESNTESALPTGYAVCPVCGNTYDIANIDEKCAFCQAPKDNFFTF
jgi:rubrerythrin